MDATVQLACLGVATGHLNPAMASTTATQRREPLRQPSQSSTDQSKQGRGEEQDLGPKDTTASLYTQDSIPTTHNEEDDLMSNSARIRTTRSKSRDNIPLNELTILEDRVYEPGVSAKATTTPVRKTKTVQDFEDKSWKNLWGISQFGSELLENKGSVARDHVSNKSIVLFANCVLSY